MFSILFWETGWGWFDLWGKRGSAGWKAETGFSGFGRNDGYQQVGICWHLYEAGLRGGLEGECNRLVLRQSFELWQGQHLLSDCETCFFEEYWNIYMIMSSTLTLVWI